MKKHLIICLLFAVAACRKEQLELRTQEISTGTGYTLREVCFTDDSTGYICGGERWEEGVFLQTTDGGYTWSVPDSIFSASAYGMHFFDAANGIVAGNNSFWAVTADSGMSFSVTQSNYRPINSISFINALTGVKAGGDGYANGYLAYTDNGGLSWSQTEYATAMNAVQYADSSTVFACGFGVVYKSVNSGQKFEPLDVRGDIFNDLHFVNAQTGYVTGYEGTVLKTENGGAVFSRVRKGNAPFSPREYLLCVRFADELTGYVAGEAGLMYRTTDGGKSWTKIKSFTSEGIHDLHLFDASGGIAVCSNGKVFQFRL